MATRFHDPPGRRVFTFDLSTMENDDIAPDDDIAPMDEMRDTVRKHRSIYSTAKASSRHRPRPEFSPQSSPTAPRYRPEPQEHRQLMWEDSHSSYNKENGSPGEERTPPPRDMEIITNSSSQHPDFKEWKRDMKLRGNETKRSFVAKDYKAKRFHRPNHLRSLISDSSTEPASSVEEHPNDEYSSTVNSYSSYFQEGSMNAQIGLTPPGSSSEGSMDAQIGKTPPGFKPCPPTHEIQTVFIKSNRTNLSQDAPLDPPIKSLSPKSRSMLRDAIIDIPLSPKKGNKKNQRKEKNVKEVDPLIGELFELKVSMSGDKSASKGSSSKPRKDDSWQRTIRLPSPPQTPQSPRSPSSPLSKENSKHFFPPGLDVPELAVAKVQQHIESSLIEAQSNFKAMIEEKSRDMKGIPATLSIPNDQSGLQNLKASPKKTSSKRRRKKKRVRFAKHLVTDIQYRPKTPKDQIDRLYYQEDELYDWENDEYTTPADRFEVVLSETKLDEPPSISFHTSFSFSEKSENSDIESCCSKEEEK